MKELIDKLCRLANCEGYNIVEKFTSVDVYVKGITQEQLELIREIIYINYPVIFKINVYREERRNEKKKKKLLTLYSAIWPVWTNLS